MSKSKYQRGGWLAEFRNKVPPQHVGPEFQFDDLTPPRNPAPQKKPQTPTQPGLR